MTKNNHCNLMIATELILGMSIMIAGSFLCLQMLIGTAL